MAGIGAVLAIRGMAANRLRQWLLLETGNMRENEPELNRAVMWGDRIFEKCGIRRDEEGDGGKTLEIRGKRRLSARDGGANYQQS